ncbi:MAG: IS1595 family transposase [Acidobacteriaceae bacterium]|nr:IS1595 family transposase [Acidobacteriaceae bacterium]
MERKPKTLVEATREYGDADKALAEVADSRWKDSIVCPHCGAASPMFLKTRRIWKCSTCRKQFSIKAGTVMEDSPIGLDKWLPAIWMIANNRNGVSSWELSRALGVTQKTAWFMLHRIRLAMQDGKRGGKLNGEVEIDETFIGGKARNMHADAKRKKLEGKRGGAVGKVGVQGILKRGGNIRVNVINDTRFESLIPNVEENVEKGAHIYTDELQTYFCLQADYAHDVINHTEMYVNGQIHLNSLENFWSLLKRGLGGTYVSVEPFHLFRYVDEQAFRYNHRKDENGNVISDYERFKAALSQIVGRRLTYKELTGKEAETSAEEAF